MLGLPVGACFAFIGHSMKPGRSFQMRLILKVERRKVPCPWYGLCRGNVNDGGPKFKDFSCTGQSLDGGL